ncbi:MAG: F0F1 ATP synthase subunit A [Blautia sp.]|nr:MULTISPECIES: F0F1 ATP synthase subunit A [Blautia]
MAERITEELNCETVFNIPIFGGIPIGESVVVTWIIMAVLTLLAIVFVRNLKVENPGKKQLALEAFISFLDNFFTDILGKEGRRYIPYLISTALYIGVANLIGLLGFKPPTKDLNVTAALSLMSLFLIYYSGFHKKGMKGFLKSFAEPMPLVTPINIMEIAIRPISLCMRLFGNVIGSFVIMELLKTVMPAILPIPFSLYFDVFDGLIQTYVFVFLTSLFIKEQIEE